MLVKCAVLVFINEYASVGAAQYVSNETFLDQPVRRFDDICVVFLGSRVGISDVARLWISACIPERKRVDCLDPVLRWTHANSSQPGSKSINARVRVRQDKLL